MNDSTNGAEGLCVGGWVLVLSPPPGAEAQLLPCLVGSWNTGGTLSTLRSLGAGIHDVWGIGDSNPVVGDLKLDDVTVASGLSCGAAGGWAWRGPYRTTLMLPGTIKLQATVTNGAVAFAATRVDRVTTTSTVGSSTATVLAWRPVAAGAAGISRVALGVSGGLNGVGVVISPVPVVPVSLSGDGLGDTTRVGKSTLTWDGAERNVWMTRAGVSSTWTRDATGRVRGRVLSGAAVGQWRPGCVGDGDSPALPRSAGGAIGETGQRLPGGVMLSWRVSPTVTEGDRWSYPNIHGDTLVTTDAVGTAVTGLLTYSPDGRPMSGAAANVVGSADYGWLGSHSRPAEDGATIIGMGARPYLPTLGRFLSVDPVEAGRPNDYVYPPDPVNQWDLTGLSVSVLRRQSGAWGETQPDALAGVLGRLPFIDTCGAIGAGVCWTHLGGAQRNSIALRFDDGKPTSSELLSGNTVARTPLYHVDLQIQTASHYFVTPCVGWHLVCGRLEDHERYEITSSETVIRLSFQSKRDAAWAYSLLGSFWI